MLRFLSAGESHGRGLVGMIESFPAGIRLDIKEINRHLWRRQQGYGRGARMRIESDAIRLMAGVRNGTTLGSPISFIIDNKDWPNWRKIMDPVAPVAIKLSDRQKRLAYDVTAPRPGHADLAGAIKYDTHDLRNVLERASARETAVRVACGAIARQFLDRFNIRITSHVLSIGKATLRRKNISFADIESIAETSEVRCIDKTTAQKMIAEIKDAARHRDTLGGIFEVRACNVPVGLGGNAQWFMRLDAALAEAVMSIQSVKGVEIGDAFANSRRRGSKVHDPIYYKKTTKESPGKHFLRRSNGAGGVEGGLSNGAELIVRGACKPISTLMQPLDTVDVVTKEKKVAMVERSDICVIPAAAVVGEAMVAMVLASAFTDKFGQDNLAEISNNYTAYMRHEF